MKQRKELYCGTRAECTAWRDAQPEPDKLEIVTNEPPGPECSVFYRRKPKPEPGIRAVVRRMTRGTVRVNGVSKNHNRPLWVSLEPGDVIGFCPIGTSQRVEVPAITLYKFADFQAAKAKAAASKAAKRKAREGK